MVAEKRGAVAGRVRKGVFFCSFSVLSFALCTACEREHRQLAPREGCETPEVVACLQKYAYDNLTGMDRERVTEQALRECLSEDASVLRRQKSCLPMILGRDLTGFEVMVWVECEFFVYNESRRHECIPVVGYNSEGPLSWRACCVAGGSALHREGSRLVVCVPSEYERSYVDRYGLKRGASCLHAWPSALRDSRRESP